MKMRKTPLISLFITGTICCLLPLSALADYFLVYGTPAAYVDCGTCRVKHVVKRVHYRPHHCRCATKHVRHHVVYRKRSSYTMTVYYPLPAYAWAPPPSPCCCGTRTTRVYYSEPVYTNYPGVYFINPGDRLVGNAPSGYSYYGPDMDGGTADNDVY